MKIWKIAVVVTLAVALVLGVTLPGLAASDETVPQTADCWPRLLKGEVLSVDEVEPKSFVIQSGEEGLTILVDENTRYFMLYSPKELLGLAQQRVGLRQQNQERARVIEPAVLMQLRAVGQVPQPKGILEHQRANLKQLRHFGEKATFDDIAVGNKVVVWLAPETNGYLAKIVTIIEPTTYARVAGTITGVSDDFIDYQFLSPWMALNQENYEKYKQMNRFEQVQFLKHILRENLKTISKGFDYIIPDIEEVKVDANWVLQAAVEVHERCMQHEEVKDQDGVGTGEYKFEHAGANRSLELIGKHVSVQAFPSKIEVTGPNGGPIEQVIMDKDEYKKMREEMLKDDDV